MSAAPSTLALHPLAGLPLFEPGDDVAACVGDALEASGLGLEDGDILVVAQKIVSKAEGRYVDFADIVPGSRAREIAQQTGKDPRHVEIVLSESSEVVKVGPNVVVVAHRLGFVMANAGIDESNIGPGPRGERVLLLPENPDGSAAEIRSALEARFAARCAVIVNDSFGRPWRNGVVGVAIGASGFPSLLDRVGADDLYGRPLKVTEIALADEVASAASLLMGQAGEGIPVVLVRGLKWDAPERPASALLRAKERDMFR